MGFSSMFQKSSVAKYAQGIKETPRHIIFNGPLWFSSFLYALSAIPLSKCYGETENEGRTMTTKTKTTIRPALGRDHLQKNHRPANFLVHSLGAGRICCDT
jgi:hypothetical protein